VGGQFGATSPPNVCGGPLIQMRHFLVLNEVEKELKNILKKQCFARSKFGFPVFESEALWKQIYSIEGSICDIVENFRRPPQSFGVRGIAPLCTRWSRPCMVQ